MAEALETQEFRCPCPDIKENDDKPILTYLGTLPEEYGDEEINYRCPKCDQIFYAQEKGSPADINDPNDISTFHYHLVRRSDEEEFCQMPDSMRDALIGRIKVGLGLNEDTTEEDEPFSAKSLISALLGRREEKDSRKDVMDAILGKSTSEEEQVVALGKLTPTQFLTMPDFLKSMLSTRVKLQLHKAILENVRSRITEGIDKVANELAKEEPRFSNLDFDGGFIPNDFMDKPIVPQPENPESSMLNSLKEAGMSISDLGSFKTDNGSVSVKMGFLDKGTPTSEIKELLKGFFGAD